MVREASIIAELESLLGPGAVLPPERAAQFAVDGAVPRAAVAPATAEEAAELLRYAGRRGLAVIPWGAGTLMALGNLPRRYDIALSLARLDRVLEHEPADLTVTCQAGIPLSRLQERLAAAGQMVPLEAPWGGEATVGGILAAGASGPRRHAYGHPRDFTIGLRVVAADGRITRAGGRVVKNVAGYDLCKLYIGSLGTLGVIVEATFKVAPLPRAEASLALAFDGPAPACALAAEAHRRGLTLRSLQLLSPQAAADAGGPADRWLLLLDLAGSPPAVERSRREIQGLAPAQAARPLERAARLDQRAGELLSPGECALLCRAGVLPSRLPALLDRLQRLEGPPRLLALPTVGAVRVGWPRPAEPEGLVERLRRGAAELGGVLVVEACSPELKGGIDVFGPPPPAFDLMRRVKEQFDPGGVLSPGRFLGRL